MTHPATDGEVDERAPFRVAIVDDDPGQLRALQTLLSARGMEVHATSVSADAVSLVERVEPDVVVLDVHMPAPNGFDLCRELLDRFDTPPAILFLSSDGSAPQVVEGLEAGAIDYVPKVSDARFLLAKVENAARLGRRMRRLADRAVEDALTGLPNRAALDRRAAELLALAGRHRRPLSCLLVDVDRFKAVNDTHGHGVGDAVLVEVAARLRRTCRIGDAVFRMGGEEFVVLAPETRGPQAAQLGERARRAVAGAAFDLYAPGSEPAAGARVDRLTATVSVGVAEWRPGWSVEDLFAAADRAMYAAKRAGRNRVVAAPAERFPRSAEG